MVIRAIYTPKVGKGVTITEIKQKLLSMDLTQFDAVQLLHTEHGMTIEAADALTDEWLRVHLRKLYHPYEEDGDS